MTNLRFTEFMIYCTKEGKTGCNLPTDGVVYIFRPITSARMSRGFNMVAWCVPEPRINT